MTSLKVCLNCGDLTDSTRCGPCRSEHERQRGGANARGYTRTWEKRASEVKKRQPSCVACGTTSDLTVDHIVPKAAGGTDDITNLRTLCRRHNSSKGSR